MVLVLVLRCGDGEGAGEVFRRDWRARQVPSRPFPAINPSSEEVGGVEGKRRLVVKRERVGYWY